MYVYIWLHLLFRQSARASGHCYSKDVFKRGHYYFALVYKVEVYEKQNTDSTDSVDMGGVHLIASFDGEKTTIYNSRFLRSTQRYIKKIKALCSAKMDRSPKRSKH